MKKYFLMMLLIATSSTHALKIHQAARRGDLQEVKRRALKMAREGKKPLRPNRNGKTAIDIATEHGKWDVVAFLNNLYGKTPEQIVEYIEALERVPVGEPPSYDELPPAYDTVPPAYRR